MENNVIITNAAPVTPAREPAIQKTQLETEKRQFIRQHDHKKLFSYGKALRIVLLTLLAPIVLYYLWTRGFVYLNYSKDLYTEYFWGRAPWLLVHIVLGIVATLIGPFQFIAYLRRKYIKLHRILGKIYLGSILISTLISFYLVSTSGLGIAYGVGLTALGVVWLSSSTMAYVAIRKRNIIMHREWMTKSYVLTLAFISFRFVEDIMIHFQVGEFIDRKILMAWGCWAIPFFVTEVILQSRKLASQNSQAA